jgi:signal transduction histidine kinase
LANDGESALQSAVEYPPDLIVSDVMMPRRDGSALVEAVRSADELRNIPIILLSARAGEESQIEGLQSGADDYLVKPFSARELLARVNTHLTMARIRQQAEQRLAEEAEALTKLNQRSMRLWQSQNLEEGFDQILGAVIELLGADKGNVLLSDQQGMRLAAHDGFEHNALDFFQKVSSDKASACGRALSSGERVVIEDVETDSVYAALRPAARAAGVRAVVSTPLGGSDGAMLGIVSAHFRSVHRPTDQDLRRMDLYLRQAADFIRRCRTEENYRKLAETLDVEVRARTKELDGRNAEMLKQSEQVRELSRRLLTMQDEERRHIARELHDCAGQNLAVLSIHLGLLVEDIQKQAPGMSQQAIEIQNLVRQIDQEIRTNSYLLHPPLLDEAGLPAALQWYIDGLSTRSDLDVTLDLPHHFERPSPEIELVLFRIVQECLTNIHRHSGATHASIRIASEPETIALEVEDDGKGMSAEKLAEIQLRGSGVGIRGMRERVRQFHGELKVESTSCGTKIRVNIPVPKNMHSISPSTLSPIQQAV